MAEQALTHAKQSEKPRLTGVLVASGEGVPQPLALAEGEGEALADAVGARAPAPKLLEALGVNVGVRAPLGVAEGVPAAENVLRANSHAQSARR